MGDRVESKSGACIRATAHCDQSRARCRSAPRAGSRRHGAVAQRLPILAVPEQLDVDLCGLRWLTTWQVPPNPSPRIGRTAGWHRGRPCEHAVTWLHIRARSTSACPRANWGWLSSQLHPGHCNARSPFGRARTQDVDVRALRAKSRLKTIDRVGQPNQLPKKAYSRRSNVYPFALRYLAKLRIFRPLSLM